MCLFKNYYYCRNIFTNVFKSTIVFTKLKKNKKTKTNTKPKKQLTNKQEKLWLIRHKNINII